MFKCIFHCREYQKEHLTHPVMLIHNFNHIHSLTLFLFCWPMHKKYDFNFYFYKHNFHFLKPLANPIYSLYLFIFYFFYSLYLKKFISYKLFGGCCISQFIYVLFQDGKPGIIFNHKLREKVFNTVSWFRITWYFRE